MYIFTVTSLYLIINDILISLENKSNKSAIH